MKKPQKIKLSILVVLLLVLAGILINFSAQYVYSINNLTVSFNQSQKQIAQMIVDKRHSAQTISALRAKIRELQQQNLSATAQLQQLNDKLADSTNDLQQYHQYVDQLTKKNTGLQTRMTTLQQENKRLRTAAQKAQTKKIQTKIAP